MRISDWSADVCSADLPDDLQFLLGQYRTLLAWRLGDQVHVLQRHMPGAIPRAVHATVRVREIGRNAIQQRLPYRRRTRATVPVAQDAGIALLHHLLHVGLARHTPPQRSEEHPSELQSLMRNSYALSCLNNT